MEDQNINNQDNHQVEDNQNGEEGDEVLDDDYLLQLHQY